MTLIMKALHKKTKANVFAFDLNGLNPVTYTTKAIKHEVIRLIEFTEDVWFI